MGTNATKKAASKIVAILLAALMLISVMPMTAFADDLSAKIVVEGLTLIAPPTKGVYTEGTDDEFVIDGFELEVTFQLASEIKAKDQDSAKRYTRTITDPAKFVEYGITCNYENGDVLTVADTLKYLTFNYGPEGALVFKTNWSPAVFPGTWSCGTLVEYFNVSGSDLTEGTASDSDLLIVADGQMITNLQFAGKPGIGGLKANEALATVKANIGNGKVITDLLANAAKANAKLDKDEEIELENLLWNIDSLEGTASYKLSLTSVDNAEYLNSIIMAADGAYSNAWPLLTKSAALEWTLDNGVMYTTVTKTELKEVVTASDVSGADFKIEVLPVEVPVKVYLAVEGGYAYLTTDETKAADVDLYSVGEAVIDGIEIASNPDNMTYFEGQHFNAEGMAVNLMYNDKVVVTVPYNLFKVYNIKVSYPECSINPEISDAPLTVKANNDRSVRVRCNGYNDETDVQLVVKSLGAFDAEIPSGKLVDGNYVIGWFSETDNTTLATNGKMVAGTAYYGTALTAYNKNYERVDDVNNSTYVASTILGAPVQAMNNKLGYYNANQAASFIDDSMIWTVKFAGIDGYTIQQASTGKYLTRDTLSYAELWVGDYNVDHADVDKIRAEVKTVVLKDTVSADAYWDIDGLFNVAIQSKGDSDADNFYLLQKDVTTGTQATYNSFFAADVDNGTQIDDIAENFYFFKTSDIDVKAIEIIATPDTAGLQAGDKLDLHAMVVAITYSDNSTVEVPFDDFVSYGITTNIADDSVMSAGKQTLTVALGDKTASVEIEVGGTANTALEPVRLGGADRYETAAIIANQYITALGADYKNVAVLVSSEQFPDALSGSTLAAALKAPVLLTKAGSLNATTAKVLTDNKVNTVYILGGTNAIGAAVEAELKAMNISAKRVAGDDRIATSIEIAKELAAIKKSDTVIITTGYNYADALSASSAAAKNGTPILYVDGQGAVSADVKAFITESGATKAVILGGTAAVSADIEAELKTMGLTVDRAAGADRLETSIEIAKTFADAYTGDVVALATAFNFPDALAGGVYAAQIGAPIILVDNACANADAALYVAGLDLTQVVVFGGVDAVTPATVDAVLLK